MTKMNTFAAEEGGDGASGPPRSKHDKRELFMKEFKKFNDIHMYGMAIVGTFLFFFKISVMMDEDGPAGRYLCLCV